MQEHDALLLPIAGFALQWARQYRWFNDGLTLLVAVLASVLAVWIGHEAVGARAYVIETLQHVPTFLGGTMLAHLAAQQSPIVPKYNGG